MSKPETTIDELFNELQKKLGSDSAEIGEIGTKTALLVLAGELRGIKIELGRIARVLGADSTPSSKVSQSDVPDNMLALLAALKATQN